MLEYILKLNDKEKDLRPDTLVNPFIQDFLHGSTKDKMITPKTFFIRIGALQHNRSKSVVSIINKLGLTVSHYRTCEIETTHAENVDVSNLANYYIYSLKHRMALY